MNKLIIGLVTGVLLFFSWQVSAQPVVSISPQNTEVAVNQDFSVDVIVSNFSNVASFQFPIVWNPDVIEYVSVTNINSTGLPGFSETLFGFNPESPGKLTVLWFEPNFNGVSLDNNTRIFTINFRSKQDGTTQVAITDDPPGIEVTAPDETELGMTPQNGTVKVGTGIGSGGGSTLELDLNNQSAEVGQEVCLSLRVDGFTDVSQLDFSVQFNASLLRFTGARNFNAGVGGLGAGAIANPSSGVLRFGWSAGGGSSTLPDGSVLLELCFEALAEGNPQVRFTNNPVTIAASQLVDGQQQDMTVNTNNGRINITDGNTGVEGFQLRMPNASVEPGDNFCLPIRVNDFADIVGLQFTVRFDPNLLQFNQASNFNGNVPDLGAGNLSNPSPGVIRFQWNDGGFTGIDLADNAVLFELCFTARNAGSTAVSFSDNPLAIEVTQKVGADDQQLLDFTVQNATVTIQGDASGPGFNGFGLYLEDRVVESGEQFCLPVKVQDFDNILGMQFSIQYDPNALQLDETRNFGLNGLSSGSIGNPSPGAITLVWDDPAVSGQTLADGAVLFELCFTALANNGTSSVVSFEDSPTPVEFIQVNGNDEAPIDFSFRDGLVIFGSGSFDGFGLLIGDETVESGADFCVPVTVQEFQDILGMQFSISYNPNLLQFNSVQNFGLNGLSSGSVGNPSPGAITLVWDDPAVTGQSLNDGDVLLEICFTALGPNGTTTFLSLADTPTPIEFIQVMGNNEVSIDYGAKVGIITIGEDELSIEPRAVPGGEGGTIVVDVACFGESSGAITLEVTGGSTPYSYQWNYQNATSKDLNNIPAGTYLVTVTDSKGATATAEFSVEQPAAALGAEIQVTESDCGAQTGSISVTVNGGTAPYSINWGGNLTDDVTEQTGLAAGQYSFLITDANGCTFSSGNITVDEQGNTQITLTPQYIAPDAGGSITANVSGDAPFTYAWSGPNNFSSQDQNLSNLQVEGEYCLTVTDGNGCPTTACITMYRVLRFAQVDVSPTCAGDNNGRIEVNIDGGLTPYSYQWSQGSANGAVLDNLAPGNYGLTVTDGKGDQINGSFEVTQLSAIALEAEVKKVTGTNNNTNGSIDLSITGGRPGYTINWDNGATGTQLNNLAVGTYCVTVTDQNDCSATACYEVKFEEVPLSFQTDTEPVSCVGESDGVLTLTIQGGSAPYQVTFAGGGSVNSNTGLVQRGDLPAGQVSFTIRDADNSTVQGSAMITQPAPIEITEATVMHDTDAPGCTGSIRLSISGGTPGYSVLWNAPNTGAQIINLCAGDFVPTIADANGCTQTFDPITVNTFGITGEVTNASCPSDANGAIQLTVTGGETPYTYQWANGAGESLTGNATLNDILPGNYRVTITEGSGNQLVREFVVGSASNLTVAVEVLTDFNGFGVSCAASEDGVLRASAANGTGGYMYEWTRGEEMVGAQAELSDVPGGLYEVTAIDESGCVVTTEVELSAPPEIIVAETITGVSCTGNADGEIEVRATGGAGNNFYTFEWSTGVSGARITRLRASTYTVTVTDAFDCQTVRDFTVEEPAPLVVVVETEPATDGCNGTAEAVVTGGTAPYFFTWNSAQTGATITDLCPGNYSVQVTDSRGCTPDEKDSMLAGLVSDRRFPCMEAVAVLTPNGDGDNERFLINCVEEFPGNQLEVYNRWGQLVFEAENYDNNWGGTDPDGNVLPEGPYYYVLVYTDNSGNAQQLKGSLTILRDY